MAKHPRYVSPKSTGLYPDRDLDCQMAMEDVFQSVAEYGEAAGWTEREVADALIELAHNRWFMLDAKGCSRKRPASSFGRARPAHSTELLGLHLPAMRSKSSGNGTDFIAGDL